MKVTAREIIAAWVELDRQAPYHTENKPIGTDRKRVEGPAPTNESFPNSWLPTQKAEVQPECAEQIGVASIQVAGMKRADREVIPGVPAAMFRAWEKAHDLFLDIYDQPTQPLLEQLTHYLAQFVKEVQRVGLYVKPEDISRLESYAATHPPDRRGRYSGEYMSDILDELDTMIGRVHGEATRLTNTTREQWYEYEAEQMRVNEDRARHNWDNKVLKKKEPRLTPEELLDQRGEMAPFYDEIWKRKRRHELTGMRVTAIDVQRPPNNTRMAPQPPEPEDVQPSPQYDADEEEGYSINPDSVPKTIGEIAEWGNASDEGIAVEGSVFHYRKRIEFSDQDSENALEFDVFVEPLANRKKRLLANAKRMRGYNPLSADTRDRAAEELEREANGMPDDGYISDVEVFYRGSLFFHRERAFTPQQALTSREFMSGDSLQRATTDLQQFIRTQIDPVPVGQWYQSVQKNPGKGDLKLSHREETMKITAAEVLPFDPSKRRLKTMPPMRKGPMQNTQPENWENLPGDDDYENLLLMFDSTAGGLQEMMEGFVRIQDSLPAEQSREAGMIILKLQGALRALGA